MEARPSNIGDDEFLSFKEASQILADEFGIVGWGKTKIINLLRSKFILRSDRYGVSVALGSPHERCFREVSKILQNGLCVTSVLVNIEGIELIRKHIEENPGYKCLSQWEIDMI
jgi:hypothetical protein